MKLSWIFGPSMEAHHLLYAYVAVWLIQGGYAAWIAWHWMHDGMGARPSDTLNGPNDNS
ncbi:MAG: hypothetical protein ABR910_08680 [Acidobacteriaceae bacterium]|jgi:hypothetical protein